MSLQDAPSSGELIGQTDHEKFPQGTTAEPAVEITRSITGVRWYLLIFAILSSTLLFSLDNSIVADIQPKIIGTFGNIDKLPWLSVAFALGTAATTLVWAALYTAFDAKWNYLVALFLFEVGSAICGAANKMDVLIFGRALAGLGGAGLYVGVMTLLSALTTPTERPIYLASIGLLWGLGSVLGPVIGGAFADSKATWRWSFYINLVVAGVFVPVYLFMIPSVNPQKDRTALDKFYKLDFAGAILIMGLFGCGITGLSFGGTVFAWDSTTTIVLLVFAVVLLVAFIVQQAWTLGTTQRNRLFPMHYFKNRNLTFMFVFSILGAPPIIVPVYFISLFFQFAKGDTALQAAVRLLPFMVMTVFFSLVNGGVMSKDGRYAPWFIFGSAGVVTGSTLLYTVDEHTSNSAIYGYSALLGIGAGSILQASFVVAQAIVPRAEMPLSVAFINLGQMAGLVLSLTIANTIFLNLSQKYIVEIIPTASSIEIKRAISGANSTYLASLDPAVKARIISAIISAIGKAYILLIAVGCLEFILSFFLKWERVFLQM